MTLINVYHVCLFYMAFITLHYYVINCHHVVIVFDIVLIMFQRFVWSICIILLLFWHGLYHNSSFVSLFSTLCNCFHLPSIMFHQLANQCSSFCHCFCFFPTCQVRVVRFYLSCLLLLLLLSSSSRRPPPLVVLLLSLSSSSRCPPRPPAQLRLAIHSVRCRTSTTTIHAQCSLPDLNHDHPRPVFPAGPQPRPSTPSVPCRTSTTTIHAQCSLPDLNHDHPRPVFPAGPQPRVSTPSVPCRTSCRKIWDKECAEES